MQSWLRRLTRTFSEIGTSIDAAVLASGKKESDAAGHVGSNLGPQRFELAEQLLLLIPIAAVGYLYWDQSRHFESTDDAFIAARAFSIAPKISGYITAVPVTDNQHVAAGDVVAQIDDRDYGVALDQARAQVANAEANISNIDAQITAQQAQVSAGQAQLEQAQAALVFAQQQADRYEQLAQKGSGTIQNAQQYASQLHQQTQQRRRHARRGQGTPRPGEAQPLLHDRHRGPAGPGQPWRGGRRVRTGRHRARVVRAG